MLNTLARAGALIGAAVLTWGAIADIAAAAPPPDVFRDANGNVYIHGTLANTLSNQANSRIGLNEPLTRAIRAGYCGEVRLSTSSSLPSIGDSWTIAGASRAQTSLPAIADRNLLPRCSGNAFSPALTTAMTTAGGFIDSTGTTPRVYLTGFTPGVSYEVGFDDVDASQAARANQCGFYRLSNTSANPLPAALTINGTSYTVSSLTVADPPLCQRNSSTGQYIRYNPISWN